MQCAELLSEPDAAVDVASPIKQLRAAAACLSPQRPCSHPEPVAADANAAALTVALHVRSCSSLHCCFVILFVVSALLLLLLAACCCLWRCMCALVPRREELSRPGMMCLWLALAVSE